MFRRATPFLLALCLVCPRARADEPQRQTPVLQGSDASFAEAGGHDHDLLVFKGTVLLNEFVYRAVLKLPPDATATPQTARTVAASIAAFLGDAGYDLAKVRAQVRGDQIEVQVDEGALDKIIFVGAGWITALRFRAALNLPLDVFNRRLFELQMPRLAKQFGMRGYQFQLLPVHGIEQQGMQLDDMEELRAMPLIRAARGYELRVFAQNEPWGTGFSPEVILNGAIGVGLGGRYRWKDLLQDGDRWQAHFRAGGTTRSALDPSGGTRLVNTNDYFTGRWLSRPWGGSSRGLRMTIAPHAEQWTLQRRDLMLESYRIGTLELGSGAGAQLLPEFSLFFTLGMQRRWIFDVQSAANTQLDAGVAQVPAVSSRGFLRASSQYVSNPEELRQDLRNTISLELNAFRPTGPNDRGYFHLDLQGRRIFPLGWHELRLGAHLTGELGDVWYMDEVPLSNHLRIGFGFEKYTKRVLSSSVELRYSLLRDKVKVGVFNDLGVWRQLLRVDAHESPELAGSFGAGAFFFVLDELQIDAYYGAGWSTDVAPKTGLALAIKEAF